MPPRRPQDAPKAPKTIHRQRFGDDFKKILEDFWKSFGMIFCKILPTNLPPLLEDFRFASLFLRAAYRATLARRAPALRAQYGGRACQRLAVSGRGSFGLYIGY